MQSLIPLQSNLEMTSTSQQERLKQDFVYKATSVLHKLEGELVVTTETPTVTLIIADSDNGKFKNTMLGFCMRRLRVLTEGEHAEGPAKHAASIMQVFGRLAKDLPEKIPLYFKDYVKNPDIYGYVEDKYYWPDGTIERYQDEIEPIIVYTLEKYTIDNPPTGDFQQLKTEYKARQKVAQ